jgi:sugar fermentation stimulation protein A
MAPWKKLIKSARSLVRHLIETEAIPELRGFELARSEVTRGKHQFDFLLRKGKRKVILDVKSCTPAVKRIATYPHEATDESERTHLEELAGLSSGHTRAGLLFIADWPKAKVFIPDFHTDLKYAQTLLELKEKLTVIGVGLSWEKGQAAPSRVRMLETPWDVIESEAKDRGSYMVVLRLPRSRKVKIGSLGK